MITLPAEYLWNSPARLEHVDLICSAAGVVLDQFSIPSKDRFAVELLMREGLNNAVIHGCANDASQSIQCRVTVLSGEVSIVIEDSGAGFDWRALSFKLSDPGREGGRGMSIYKLYASEITFNDSGNCVTLKRIMNVNEGMDLSYQELE